MTKKRLRRAIPEVVAPDPRTIQFSFKHLHCDHETFPINDCPDGFWTAFVMELKRYGSWTTDQFTQSDNADNRHIIEFGQTVEEKGFTDVDLNEIEWSESWQFGIGERSRGWRAHGFIVGDIFYLHWLDSSHTLYNIPKSARRNNER